MEGEVKRTLMAFTSILTIDPVNQNKIIIENISTIIAQVLKIAEQIDAKKQKRLVNGSVKVDLESEDEDQEALDKREEELNDFLKQAQKTSEKDDNNNDNDDELWEEDDEDDEDWDEFSNLTNITPMDKVDEIIYIQEVFKHISQSSPAYYQDLMKLIDDASKIKLETFISNAQARNLKGES